VAGVAASNSSVSRVLKPPTNPKMAISKLSTPCVKLASFLTFSPASRETRVRAQAVENAFFNSLLGDSFIE
jgi:hypothetical protein